MKNGGFKLQVYRASVFTYGFADANQVFISINLLYPINNIF